MINRNEKVRHGDMIILKLDNTRTDGMGSRNLDKVVVGLGEVTGHSHDLVPAEGTELSVYSTDEKLGEMTQDQIASADNLIFKISGDGAVLTHDEHNEIFLEEGTYMRTFQREYNPFKEVVDKVRD